ncbi:hypothetical protein HOC32_01375 [Candidatus Woesearchaeota archaeon]|nr:hypothetical protein [Candidatus Woesearchaeota archaeon]
MTIATDYEIPQEILNGLSPAVLAALLEEQAENDDNKFSLDELVTNERNTELELVKSEEKDNQFSTHRHTYGGILGVGTTEITHQDYGNFHHITVDPKGIVTRLIPGKKERVKRYIQDALKQNGAPTQELEQITVKKIGYGLLRTVIAKDEFTAGKTTENGYEVRLLKAVGGVDDDQKDNYIQVEFTPLSLSARLTHTYGRVTGEQTEAGYDSLQETVGRIVRGSIDKYVARDATEISYEKGKTIAKIPTKWLYTSEEVEDLRAETITEEDLIQISEKYVSRTPPPIPTDALKWKMAA